MTMPAVLDQVIGEGRRPRLGCHPLSTIEKILEAEEGRRLVYTVIGVKVHENVAVRVFRGFSK